MERPDLLGVSPIPRKIQARPIPFSRQPKAGNRRAPIDTSRRPPAGFKTNAIRCVPDWTNLERGIFAIFPLVLRAIYFPIISSG